MTTKPNSFDVSHAVDCLPEAETAEQWFLAAWKHQGKRLTDFGNVLSPDHSAALLAVQQGLVLQTFDDTKRRLAYALETGMGKTQSLVSYCYVGVTQGHLSAAGGRSVVIAAAQVEQLCTLLRDMVDAGVPRSSIGLFHSYAVDPALKPHQAPPDGYRPPQGKASIASDADAFDRPILLATHMQTRGPDAEWMFDFDGRPRSLMVFDESLFRSDAMSMDFNTLREAIGQVREFMQPASRAVEFCSYIRNTLLAELERQGEDQAQEIVSNPPIEEKRAKPPAVLVLKAPDDLEDIHGAIKAVPQIRKLHQVALDVFFDSLGEPLTIVATPGDGPGIIQFEPSVSDSLRNVAILDASYFVRRLYELDDTIRPVQGLHGGVKTYPGTTVKWYRMGSGRAFTSEDMRKPLADSFYSRYIVAAVKEAGEQPVLVFTFGKQSAKDSKELDMERALRTDLIEAGIDPDGLVPGGHRRVNILTWGSETSRSDLKFCRVVIFAGVMHQDRHSVRARMSGQARNLSIMPAAETIKGTVLSETLHSVMQAVNRSQARVITDGKAGAVTVHLPLHGEDEIMGVMSTLPGAELVRTVPEFMLTPEVLETAKLILSSIGGIDTISAVSLKTIGKLFTKETKPKRSAMDAALRHIEELGGWKRDTATRSMVRVPAR